jgi:hypothetical protein
MSKIASEHLELSAYIYIRQSTPDQVHRNPESPLCQDSCRL